MVWNFFKCLELLVGVWAFADELCVIIGACLQYSDSQYSSALSFTSSLHKASWSAKHEGLGPS